MIKGWEELWRKLNHLIEFGFHCNDINHNDFEDDITFAFEKFARENNLPEPQWGEETTEPEEQSPAADPGEPEKRASGPILDEVYP